MKTYFCVAFVLALAGVALCQQAATQAAVPVEQEPHHHVVLKNDSVLVTHVVIPPGEATLYHTHSYDRAAVHLTNNMILAADGTGRERANASQGRRDIGVYPQRRSVDASGSQCGAGSV